MRFRFDSTTSKEEHVSGSGARILQEGGLTDTGLA
jgi:hypothetical protein